MTPQQHRIIQMVERGTSFTRIENEINAAPGLTEDQRAALWLYAWSYRSRYAQRREAAQMVFAE